MTILEAWEWYKKDKEILKYSPYTLKAYSLQAQLLAREFNNCNIDEITYEALKEYLYKQRHLKPASLGHRIRFIRSFFRWAVDEGYLNKNPAAKLREPKMDQRIPKFLNEEEVETLRAACTSPLEHAIVEFMYTTGCRVGEIVKVNKNDIDWDNCSVIVDGKGGKQREVCFSTQCKIWLKKYLNSRRDNDPALFATERKPHRMSVAEMRYILKRIARKAELPTNVYPHRLRHAYATHLLNNGAPMEAIQQLLGHSKSESTALYAHLSGQRRREIYRRYF